MERRLFVAVTTVNAAGKRRFCVYATYHKNGGNIMNLNESLLEIAKYALPVPICIGITELAKQAGFPARYAGLLSAGVGVALGVVGVVTHMYPEAATPIVLVLGGLVAGLMGAGVWSTTKNAIQG